MTIIDIRTEQPLGTIKAHEGSLCGISVSSKVPNMIVTASEDEVVKVWDMNASTASSESEDQSLFELVFEKTLKIVSQLQLDSCFLVFDLSLIHI